jgi:cell division protein FtsA
MVELGEDIFLKPVRVGVPDYSGGLTDVVKSPRYSTVMGLMNEAKLQAERGRVVRAQTGGFRQTLARMKDWVTGTSKWF